MHTILDWLQSNGNRTPQWQAVLDLALSLNLQALLDCGALLAGATNQWVVNIFVPAHTALPGSCRLSPHWPLYPGFAGLTGLPQFMPPSSCSEAADYLLTGTALDAHGLKGVCFYDGSLHKGWVIKDRVGRITPRHSSPIAEREVSSAWDPACALAFEFCTETLVQALTMLTHCCTVYADVCHL
jgi:hypothetical protein